jgi:hypothetical protein
VNVISWNALTSYMLAASGGDDEAMRIWDLVPAHHVANFTYRKPSPAWVPQELHIPARGALPRFILNSQYMRWCSLKTGVLELPKQITDSLIFCSGLLNVEKCLLTGVLELLELNHRRSDLWLACSAPSAVRCCSCG